MVLPTIPQRTRELLDQVANSPTTMAPLRSHADRRLERARHSLHADVLNHLTPDDLVQQALERGTLSVCMGADGGREIEQLLRASNQPVSPATAIAVQRWLANEGVSN